VHHPGHDKAAEYRHQAQEIRTIAQRISIDEAREQLLETAKRLEGLAEEEERRAHADGVKPELQSEA
jgi:GTP cyclohydrolase I